MIQSMTGFSSKLLTISIDPETKANVSLHLKSLNARFLETTCKLPHPLLPLEQAIIKKFKENLRRGYIYFTIHVDNLNIFKGSVEPALPTAKSYVSAIDHIKTACNLEQELSLNTLITLPNIFTLQEKELDKKTQHIILETVSELITNVIEQRNKEGQALQKDLEQRLSHMSKEINEIEKESVIQVEEQKKKVHEVLLELGDDDSDFATIRKNALYAVLDKIDVHEEIVRFKSHLQAIDKIIKSPKVEKGKQLDFTFQELAREINTITAKCSNASMSTRAISIKVEIEKAREQVQNVV